MRAKSKFETIETFTINEGLNLTDQFGVAAVSIVTERGQSYRIWTSQREAQKTDAPGLVPVRFEEGTSMHRIGRLRGQFFNHSHTKLNGRLAHTSCISQIVFPDRTVDLPARADADDRRVAVDGVTLRIEQPARSALGKFLRRLF